MLKEVGYKDVIGIDPFIASSKIYKNGTEIKKIEVSDLTASYDVITLNHVFEHLTEQLGTLMMLRSYLNEDGKLILRIPTVTSDAFDNYGEFWYQFDAPRHQFLHSHQSIHAILSRAGYEVVNMFCDSTIWQYYSSDLYLKNVPFFLHMREYLYKLPLLMLAGKINHYKRKVAEVNNKLRGDQIVIIAKKNGDPSQQ